MECPHCLVSFHDQRGAYGLGRATWTFEWTFCPACDMPTAWLRYNGDGPMMYPRGSARGALPENVPEAVRSDFREAVDVLSISAKASAALSRRLLQHLLRTYGGHSGRSLESEIESAMPTLPPYLAEAIDAIRHVGNFAAHPIQSGTTGEIVDVEPADADWLLDTVRALIDFYIVHPAELEAKRAALNVKLADANKPLLKSGTQAQLGPGQ